MFRNDHIIVVAVVHTAAHAFHAGGCAVVGMASHKRKGKGKGKGKNKGKNSKAKGMSEEDSMWFCVMLDLSGTLTQCHQDDNYDGLLDCASRIRVALSGSTPSMLHKREGFGVSVVLIVTVVW